MSDQGGIPIQPVPTQFTIRPVPNPDQDMIALQVDSHMGTLVFFMPVENATSIGATMVKTARDMQIAKGQKLQVVKDLPNGKPGPFLGT